ncbi:hypothetical protein M9Y10_044208 [Tritrichomonas musculus]|uniref:Uncharacterized protein n=1 Tax=Tritrichomonas musculus TaxID=1915356 RepID=A0ABR2K1V6_9EUKA
MDITPNENENGNFDDIATEMIRVMETGKGQPLNSDCIFSTPSDAYRTFIELVRQTFPEDKLEALIQARENGPTLEDALSPDFVSNLAMAELMDVLKIMKK